MEFTKQESRLDRARVSLMMGTHPQYVFLSELLEFPHRAATDGVAIHWRASFIDECDDAELLGVLIHELLHNGLFHVAVIQYCEHKDLGNIAADLAENCILQSMGMKLPADRVMIGEGDYADWPANESMEFYYARLLADRNAGDEGSGEDGKSTPAGAIADPGSLTESEDDPGDPFASPGQSPEAVIEKLRDLVDRAEKTAEHVESKGYGTMPGAMRSAIGSGKRNRVDYRKVLRQYRSKLSRGGSDWNRLNKRMRAVGINAARRKTRKVGDILVLLDCSGSMSQALVEQALAEITAIFKETAGTVHVWQHDTAVVHKDEWKRGRKVPEFERRTTGGTNHVQPFAEVKESGLRPDLVIAITDFETRYPATWKGCPVVWIGDRVPRSRPPFGRVCDIVL
jgi:predicted metal-dependent peptidase